MTFNPHFTLGAMILFSSWASSSLHASPADFPCRFDEFTQASAEPSPDLAFMQGKVWEKACDWRKVEHYKLSGPYLLQQTVRYPDSECQMPADPRTSHEYFIYTWETVKEPTVLTDFKVVKLKLAGFCEEGRNSEGQEVPSFLPASLVIRDFPAYQAFRAAGDGHLDHASANELRWLDMTQDRLDPLQEFSVGNVSLK